VKTCALAVLQTLEPDWGL